MPLQLKNLKSLELQKSWAFSKHEDMLRTYGFKILNNLESLIIWNFHPMNSKWSWATIVADDRGNRRSRSTELDPKIEANSQNQWEINVDFSGRSFVIIKSEKPESQQKRFAKMESFPTKYGSVQIQRLPETKNSIKGNSS